MVRNYNCTAPCCEHVESTSCERVESTTPMEKGCTAGLPNPGNDNLLASLNSRIEYLEEELRCEKTKSDIYQKKRDYNSIFCVFVVSIYQRWCVLGPCRVLGYPTDESNTRFRFAGSITRIGNFTLINCILINDDAINKTDRKTYHWKRQNIPFAMRYPLN